MKNLQNFYFTYETDRKMPFIGGWTRIEATSYDNACKVFRIYHPCRKGYGDILNCSFIYTQEDFEKTNMLIQGNFGEKQQEFLTQKEADVMCKDKFIYLLKKEAENARANYVEDGLSQDEITAYVGGIYKAMRMVEELVKEVK